MKTWAEIERRRKIRQAKKAKRTDTRPTYSQEDSYEWRSKILAELGFASYAAYLKSDLWSGIRQAVLRRDRGQCGACRSTHASQVHHRTYTKAALCGRSLSELVSLCRDCHRCIEFHADGSKTSIREANHRIFAIRRRVKLGLHPHALDHQQDIVYGPPKPTPANVLPAETRPPLGQVQDRFNSGKNRPRQPQQLGGMIPGK